MVYGTVGSAVRKGRHIRAHVIKCQCKSHRITGVYRPDCAPVGFAIRVFCVWGGLMGSKAWIQSKTNWFGGSLIALAIAILSSADVQAWIETLPAEFQGLALGVIGLIVWWLRYITKQPIGSKMN